MTEMQPKPEQQQIWREVDPRFERYIRVESVRPGRCGVSCRTVVLSEGKWIDARRSRVSYCDPERFNGKRGGYEFHEQPLQATP